jgi:hypothetical protein
LRRSVCSLSRNISSTFSIVKSKFSLILGSRLQITSSGFSTWKPEMNFLKITGCQLIFTRNKNSNCLHYLYLQSDAKRTCLRLSIISVNTFDTPEIVENSWSTPSIRTDVIANPNAKTLLSALPMVNSILVQRSKFEFTFKIGWIDHDNFIGLEN